MATAPFTINQTVPGDDDVVSLFPAQNRTNMDNANDWLNFEHDASGHHKIPVITEAARDAISDWVLGSLVFNTDDTELQVVTAVGPTTFTPAVASAVSQGSWTPALNFGGATTGITYVTQVGRYFKVGNLVQLWGRIQISNDGTAVGDATITGLPFAPETVSGLFWAGTLLPIDGLESFSEFSTNLNTIIFDGDNFITLGAYEISSDTFFTLDQGNFTDDADFSFAISYTVT